MPRSFPALSASYLNHIPRKIYSKSLLALLPYALSFRTEPETIMKENRFHLESDRSEWRNSVTAQGAARRGVYATRVLFSKVMVGCVMGIFFGTVLLADDSSLQIHGFGGWLFGKTNHDNTYLGGLPQGNYRRSDFSLNIEDKVSDRIRVVVQTDWTETENGHDTTLDYAFAEWRLSDKLRIRAGQVKLPFGIYSEIIDVGTLRPFLNPPQGVYGPVGFAGEHYKGIGITGTFAGRSDWSYGYDLYAGGTDSAEFLAPETFLKGQPVATSPQVEQESTSDLLGGRLTVHTPVEGLEFGFSVYSGVLIAPSSPRQAVAAGHISFLVDRWSVRTEYAYEHSSHDLTARGAIVATIAHLPGLCGCKSVSAA